jgi:hypothetical protein
MNEDNRHSSWKKPWKLLKRSYSLQQGAMGSGSMVCNVTPTLSDDIIAAIPFHTFAEWISQSTSWVVSQVMGQSHQESFPSTSWTICEP